MDFAHLHVHSEYSLLDGFSNIQKLIERTKQMGMPAVALTDHGTLFGAIDFYNAAIKGGIKPIIGVESYLAARGMSDRDAQFDKKSSHLLLLAENQTGYQNLLKIASLAQLDGFYYYPRIDHEFLAAHAEGLICTSGCMSAEVPRLIQQGNVDAARQQLDWYYEVFGKDRFFLELQEHDIPELTEINKMLVDLGRRYDAQFVATNDVHYIDQEDSRLQDIMLAIQTGCLLNDPNRMRMSSNTYYLRTAEEMEKLFQGVPGALSNTLLIAERCNVDLGFKGYHLPEFVVPEGYTPESYLRALCEAGLQLRYRERATETVYQERLNYELGVIHNMGFDTYFLIVWDLCRHAREQGIWYNARGSAAGSIVAFTLEISLVDPIEHNLIFERFLNPGRISMPDIDMDFPDDRRAEMMEYTARKYGDDKVAQIVTFGTLGARAAIRDVGRVMDIPLSEVDQVAKLIPNIPGKAVSIKTALDEITELKELVKSKPNIQELVDTAVKMEGVVRNAGTHAAGVIITDKPIIDYIPLHRPTSGAIDSPIKTVTQFEMSIVEALGLLKVDFLGLATLTIMARACDLIRQRHGIIFSLANIPTDDPATYDLLGKGETAGVFQVEGSGMRRWLMQMKPHELVNVVNMVALFRPGPMDFIPGYIRRMHGEETVEYRHPLLEPILKETYGYPVYQEQLMLVAVQLAGYKPSESDDLRKAIAKKIPLKLQQHREKFIRGAIDNGIPEETAQAIFADWEEFARYGFNKSHAVNYGIIAVQTAYLKFHYAVEYMTALLSVNKNDTAKVAVYAADCRRMGIPVEPPDVNASELDFAIEDRPDGSSVIRFGMAAVKNVGSVPVEAILKARAQGGPFKDLNDFARRVDLRQVGKRALECLVKVGALDRFGQRTTILEILDRVMAVSGAHFRAVETGQMSLFGAHTGVVENIQLPRGSNEVSRREVLNWERELIGLYVSDHPLSPVMDVIEEVVTHFSSQLADAAVNEHVRVAGIITRVRHHQSKAGKPMGFVTIEDLQGTIELVIFPRTWAKVVNIVEHDKIVLVEGKIDTQGAEPKILVDTISTEFSRVMVANRTPNARHYLPDVVNDDGEPDQQPAPWQVSEPSPQPAFTQPPTSAAASNISWEGDTPPPPDEFPPDWDVHASPIPPEINANFPPAPSRTEASRERTAPKRSTAPEPPVEPAEVTARMVETIDPGVTNADLEPEQIPQPIEDEQPAAPLLARPTPKTVQVPASVPIASLSPVVLPPYLVPPASLSTPEGSVNMLTVILRSTGDKTRDVLRLRRIHGIIMSYPGIDRFALHVFERGRGYLVEFPNFSAGICAEMLNRLTALLGTENIRVEPITFQ